ncbi:hypothetical protein OZ411_41730 [Bradyrhizobium sp. Arg237L]|uniref:hypothetical protein n=1 Tax=Bradyrhizobium sp. Arg237L TaxID=3003352 RepID=UPI00249F7FCB|nr:hypothetical protein [Bradyrhizobium sp. Arg237L]MDI4239313.1 hypothetical protein [Bradyrhizobium sp. Arg237L]
MVDETEEEVSPERAAEILGILRPLVYQRMDAASCRIAWSGPTGESVLTTS